MVAKLSQRYGERPVAVGVTDTGQLLEVYATEDGATWTIIVTGPPRERGGARKTCLVGAGSDWRTVEQLRQGAPL